VFASVTRARSDALYVLGGPVQFNMRTQIAQLALRPRLPSMERLWEDRPRGGVACGVGVREGGHLDLIARDPGQHARVRPHQSNDAGHNRVEHRLDIRLRAADDAQNVAGGGLRLQRRGQLAIARLEFSEEADVLDGDDGLVGEGLEQFDFAFVVGLHVRSRDSDRPNYRTISSHGHNEGTLIRSREHEDIAIRHKLWVIRNIVSVYDPAFDDAQAYEWSRRGVAG
jgi:hypothetical protein